VENRKLVLTVYSEFFLLSCINYQPNVLPIHQSDFFSTSAIGNGTGGSLESPCLSIDNPDSYRIMQLASCYSKLQYVSMIFSGIRYQDISSQTMQ